MTDQGIVVVDPTSGPLDRQESRKAAERPETLNGAVVALVVNGLGESDRFLEALYEELAARTEPSGKIKAVKHSVSIPPEKQDWQRITSEATVAIAGFGG